MPGFLRRESKTFKMKLQAVNWIDELGLGHERQEGMSCLVKK